MAIADPRDGALRDGPVRTAAAPGLEESVAFDENYSFDNH
jgi:hypothetical protein